MEGYMATADNIKQLRKQVGYTQAQLASLLDVDRSAIAQWENGLSAPRMGNVRRLAEVFNTRVSTILEGETASDAPPSLVRLLVLEQVHTNYGAGETGSATVEVPASLLKRHPSAIAVLAEDDSMSRIIPAGFAAIADPSLSPANGDIVIVRANEGTFIRRWYKGVSTVMLVADSHAQYADIILPEAELGLLGTVIWVQCLSEIAG